MRKKHIAVFFDNFNHYVSSGDGLLWEKKKNHGGFSYKKYTKLDIK